MKKRNRVIIIMLVVSLVILNPAAFVSQAKEKQVSLSSISSGVSFPTKEELNLYYSSVNKEKKNQYDRLIKNSPDSFASNKTGSRSVLVLGGFSIYQQSNGAWCGPATIKSILQYINGYSSSQSQIASSVIDPIQGGTSPVSFCNYLNSNNSTYFFGCLENGYSAFNQYGLVALLNIPLYSNVPTALFISPEIGDGWIYTSPGHIVAVYGTNSTTEKISIADPYGGFSLDVPKYYQVSYSAAYNSCAYLIW